MSLSHLVVEVEHHGLRQFHRQQVLWPDTCLVSLVDGHFVGGGVGPDGDVLPPALEPAVAGVVRVGVSVDLGAQEHGLGADKLRGPVGEPHG